MAQAATGLPELSPLHRIDRDTAGLASLECSSAHGAYQALFRDRQITKRTDDAIAPWRADASFPRDHVSRLEESLQFFRMHEVPGEPNSHTHMQVLEVAGGWRATACHPSPARPPVAIHMAALGLPLRNDPFYPVSSTIRPRATIRGRCTAGARAGIYRSADGSGAPLRERAASGIAPSGGRGRRIAPAASA